MKTLEVELAIMEYYDYRKNIIVPNVSWGIVGLYYECDLVRLSAKNYATEIEIKVSKADLLRDKKKFHNHGSELFRYLYFAVPSELEAYAISRIPEKSGLLSVTKREKEIVTGYEWVKPELKDYKVKVAKKPRINKRARQWTDKERDKLLRLGTMRIFGLKKKLLLLERERKEKR